MKRYNANHRVRAFTCWEQFLVMAFAQLTYREALRAGAWGAIAAVTVFDSLIWLLVAAAVAGDPAARDVQTRMHPLTYTAPVSKADYLGGRFLAAFVLNAGESSRGHTPRTRGSLHT